MCNIFTSIRWWTIEGVQILLLAMETKEVTFAERIRAKKQVIDWVPLDEQHMLLEWFSPRSHRLAHVLM
jgi:hypothetical protein